jgi:hypothetical protein
MDHHPAQKIKGAKREKQPGEDSPKRKKILGGKKSCENGKIL